MNKSIEIKCTGSALLPFQDIADFQGRLKRRSPEHLRKISTSIEKYGFSFPFFIWKNCEVNYCLDGHGRLAALQQMLEDGWQIPPLPVVYIQAKDRAEAKQKLLRMNSSFGEFDLEGVAEFISDIEIDLSEIEIKALDSIFSADQDADIPEENVNINEEEMKDTKKECPKCGHSW